MNWNGDKMNDHFIAKYEKQNPERYKYKPKIELFENLHDIELAMKELYFGCATHAWTKDELTEFLESQSETTFAHRDAIHPDKYLETYKNEVKRLLEVLHKGDYNQL